MRMFKVQAGTSATVIRDGADWAGPNYGDIITRKDNLFNLEEVTIDPAGKLGPSADGPAVGGRWARAGYYGFNRASWTLLVRSSQVEVL